MIQLKMKLVFTLDQLFLKIFHIQIHSLCAGLGDHAGGKTRRLAGQSAQGNQTQGVSGPAIAGDNPACGQDVVALTADQTAVGDLNKVRLELLLGAADGVFKMLLPILFTNSFIKFSNFFDASCCSFTKYPSLISISSDENPLINSLVL